MVEAIEGLTRDASCLCLPSPTSVLTAWLIGHVPKKLKQAGMLR